MLKGYKIVNFTDVEERLTEYHRLGARPGVYLGFESMKDFYSMRSDGCTDWTGLPQCFTKDQLIHTDKGIKPISMIQVGDKVLSYNLSSKINEYKQVLATPSHTTKQKILKIKMKDGTVIKVTENHLFFTGASYVKIKDLLLHCEEKRK